MSSKIPFVWVLHILIFVVFFPIVLELKNKSSFKEYDKLSFFEKLNPINSLKAFLGDLPKWLILVIVLLMVYVFFNFFFSFQSSPASASFENGEYVVRNHSEEVKKISEKEYHKIEAITMRGFSGHWIFFYTIGVIYLFPFKSKGNK